MNNEAKPTVALTERAPELSSTRPPRAFADVYKVAGSVEYRARAPAGVAEKEWMAILGKALGTTSTAFVRACLHRLVSACLLPGQVIPTRISISAALAVIESLEPQNELQAVLAVDAACLHAA